MFFLVFLIRFEMLPNSIPHELSATIEAKILIVSRFLVRIWPFVVSAILLIGIEKETVSYEIEQSNYSIKQVKSKVFISKLFFDVKITVR
ncbi:MAG: hypothetical protein ACFFB3_12835 [Candidatus Hodarchaeota archaeon]